MSTTMSCRTSVAWLIVFLVSATAFAASPRAEALLPLERQLRQQFPSVALDSRATLEPVQELVAGRMVSGLRARGGLRVLYPASYDEAFVVELGEQRVVLRAIDAHFAQAESSAGKLFYTSPHDGVDVIEVPSAARSEELLVLHDERAPRIFEYEIVEMRGVAGLMMQDGAIRFAPDHIAVPTVTQMVGGRFSALPSSLQIDRPWVIDAKGRRSESAARWTIVEQNDQPRRIRLTIDSETLAYPIVVDPSFSVTGTMLAARESHTATLLPNGKVLIAGGSGNSGSPLDTAELYDPSTGTFAAVSAPMSSARFRHTATLLTNGKVLIAGGRSASSPSNTAELYDPASATFTVTSIPMNSARADHTATLLPNGQVLIAGGQVGPDSLNTAEIYDAVSDTFAETRRPMVSTRARHTATMLPNGEVLIAGGLPTLGPILSTAELYSPGSRTFTAITESMTSSRYDHSAVLLSNGNVLIAGGSNDASQAISTAELYAPTAGVDGTFTATTATMTAGRSLHSATLLPDGNVLIAAGFYRTSVTDTAEVYDATSGTFTATATVMKSTRYLHTATLMPNGTVLIVGGADASFSVLNTAELYDQAVGMFTATSMPMTSGRHGHTATLLPNGKVLIAGGGFGAFDSLKTAELYDPATGTFTATSTLMTSPRQYHTATLLPNGKVLIAGGYYMLGISKVAVSTAELYEPAGGTFTATSAPMRSARYRHTATLLPNGTVLIAGGLNGLVIVNTAELYQPDSVTPFIASASMTIPRAGHTATLLPNGKVLIAGGSEFSNSAELYEPNTGTVANFYAMNFTRRFHTASLLANGKVLITGGLNGSAAEKSAELFDPNGTFTATNMPMTAARYGQTATVLPNGKVLITGGFFVLLPWGNVLVVDAAEFYDPVSGSFTPTSSSLTSARGEHSATLLPNGKALIAGGLSETLASASTAELYDPGLGHSEARRPVVSSSNNLLCQPANLSFNGFLLTGDSEGSSGSTNNSAANSPLLRLQRIDSEQNQLAFSQSFSASSFLSDTLSNLHSGPYRVAIVSNAIPSLERIIEVETTPILGTYGAAAVNLSGSTSLEPSLLPPGYNGALYPQTVSVSSEFTGTLRVNGATGAVGVTNAGPVGDYMITLSSATRCGSPVRDFNLTILGPPAFVTATGGAPQSAELNTSFATALQAKVTDSAGHPLSNITVNFIAPTSGASATLPGGAATSTDALGVASIVATANAVSGNYIVTAIVGANTATFALTNTTGIPPTNVIATATTATSVTLTWTGTVGSTYEVLRVEAGGASTIGSSDSEALIDTATANTAYLYKVRRISPTFSEYSLADLATTVIFTDPSLVSGTTTVKADHITDLRAAVNAVRALAGMGGGSYADPTLSAGVTLIKGAHVTDLRGALDAARSTLLLPAISYTRPAIVAGTTTLSLADVSDLRSGVK